MGLDRPGITPARRKAPAKRTKRKPVVVPDRVMDSRRPRPRADTGDIFAGASPARGGRTAVVRGRRVTVDAGDILAGAPPVRPAERRRAAAARQRAKPSFAEALQDEFEGKGAIGEAVRRAAPVIARALVGSDDEVRVYRRHGKTYRVPVARSGIARLGVTDGGRKVIEDAVNLPKDAVAALYEVAASGVEAAGGDTRRGKRLVGGLDEGALGRLVLHADPKGAARVAKEHPLFAALEVTGAGQIAGRGAGAVARAGAAGRRAKLAAGTKRAPLRVEGTNQRVERRYSPNVIVKGAQVAGERGKRKRGFDPNVAQGSQRSRILNAEVDEFAAQAEGIRRRGREEVARQAAKIAPVRAGAGATSRAGRARAAADRARSRGLEASGVPGARGRAERHVVLAAVEGRLRGPKTFVADVKRERARLHGVYVAERGSMSAAARKANREQVKALDRVLTDPKARAAGAEVFRAADEYNKVGGQIERELIRKGALNKDQAATARVRTYAIAHLGLKPNPDGDGLVNAAGRVVPTKVIQAQIRLRGDREPGFVGHRRSDRGAASYFVNWFGGRKTVDSKRRTGEAARTGGYDASFGALEEQLVRGRGVADAIGTFDDFVGRFGTKRRDGSPFTWAEAERSAGELGEATGMQWLPVRAVPARYDDATRANILNAQGSASTPGHLESLTLGRLDDSMRPPTGQERLARNVVLVPAQQLQRFSAHQTSSSNTAAKASQVLSRQFRNTVLPFSTKWVFGNAVEGALRSAMHGITPGDVVRGSRVMRELRRQDEKAWRATDTRVRPGLLYGSADRLSVRRGAEDFEGTVLAAPAAVAGAAVRAPIVRQIITGVKAYTALVHAMNRGLERAYQTGVIGKEARRDAQELTGSWGKAVRMQGDVVREVARGLTGTAKQVQYARVADEVLGKYSRFSPGTRHIIQSYAPFVPWAINAARFSLYALPARHPVKASLLANLEQTLAADIEEAKKQAPPGSLQHAIRRKDGGLVDLARYTPFSIATTGPQILPEQILPQLSALTPLTGRSWTGRELSTGDGVPASEAKRVLLSLNALAEATIPGIQIARRLQEKGQSPYDDSTVVAPKVKPRKATDKGAADRILNPLRPTYLKGGGSGASAPASSSAEDAEARAILREQQGTAAEQEALDREARAILRELQGSAP